MKPDMRQLLLTLSMMVAQGIELSDDQIQSIHRILLGATEPSAASHIAKSQSPDARASTELVYGLAGMAELMGTSIPTVARYRERFEPARVHFGGRKLVWDRAKVLEIAKSSKW